MLAILKTQSLLRSVSNSSKWHLIQRRQTYKQNRICISFFCELKTIYLFYLSYFDTHSTYKTKTKQNLEGLQ